MGKQQIGGVSIADSLTPELQRLISKIDYLTPAMRQVELAVMRPLVTRKWQSSGLVARSGSLRSSVVTFSGRRSAGASLKPATPLDGPKARTHTFGAKARTWRRKQRQSVREHQRRGRTIAAHTRSNPGSPWGDIPARPFVPTSLDPGDAGKIIEILEEYIVK